MVRFSVTFLALLVPFLGAVTSTKAQEEEVEDEQASCTLKCPIDAPCTFGNADYSDHPLDAFGRPIIIGIQQRNSRDAMEEEEIGTTTTTTTNFLSMNGMHCACPPLWTGIQCETQFQRCDDEDNVCYHGGQCVTENLMDEHGNTKLFCDCSNAFALDGTLYVGKFCEIALVDACGTNHNGESIFCANGGECNPNFRYVCETLE
jgi:hypothetical protein